MNATVIKAKQLVGGALIGARDYLRAGMLCAPKTTRGGGVPVQTDGWPPEAHFHVIAIPRWFAFLLFMLIVWAWYDVGTRINTVSVQIQQLRR